ncbi:hypothetical protein BT67DRAFT_444362 [Trichocladium antarcticum]|uniref:Uncharacterized protein n=1 Tax=Trichocladium antarcticum TaxID=1450529 RepID=A0AAN6UFR8_9PEZI|nr:hypothetical protein BT67DRAFT_444362 [Trichocladium antarcticum]
MFQQTDCHGVAITLVASPLHGLGACAQAIRSRPMYLETGDDVLWQNGSSNYRLQLRSGSRHILVGCLSFTRLCHDLDKARDSSSQGVGCATERVRGQQCFRSIALRQSYGGNVKPLGVRGVSRDGPELPKGCDPSW